MVFSTTVFLFLFLPCVLIGYYNPFFKSRNFKNIFLFIVSIGFYAWGEPIYVLLMLCSIIANWFFGVMIERAQNKNKNGRGKVLLIIAILYNMGFLFVFKYLMFVLTNIGLLLNRDIAMLNIALPIGISFYSFQALSYVIDVYRGNGTVQKNPLNVGIYIALFPQLIAGPIVRYKTIEKEIMNRKENFTDFSDGVNRFLKGLAKKVILANNLALVADMSFGMVSELSVVMAWLGAIAYTMQIYFDFSGYSDMAIGLGRMFGFHFMENFNFPYLARSITDFWRRWHISLGSWFRDYVYIPLGGNRVKKGRWLFNLCVVWSVTGIWHGANWTFILWGFLYFVILMVEKLTNLEKKLGWFGHVYTLFFVIILWIVFRAENVGMAFSYIQVMFGIGASKVWDDSVSFCLLNYKAYLILGVLCCVPLSKVFNGLTVRYRKASDIIYVFSVVFIMFFTISYMVKSAYNPFIYFNF
ncbi:MAG: membrane-bound O-acyltransferase family protein [Firmicutes bacterium HGW-Firmicutes-7]|nr:MAG: membrane-bound O-acyltransferase family protein [Firmicutes bacterium HGW-Firmicutes-7]